MMDVEHDYYPPGCVARDWWIRGMGQRGKPQTVALWLQRERDLRVETGERVRCCIQWIVPRLGDIPTPDTNDAIGYAFCMTSSEPDRAYPICEEHAARVAGESMGEWKVFRFQRPPPAVVDAIKHAFPDQAHVILKQLRHHPSEGFWSFSRWGMFVGVEMDGHIHT